MNVEWIKCMTLNTIEKQEEEKDIGKEQGSEGHMTSGNIPTECMNFVS